MTGEGLGTHVVLVDGFTHGGEGVVRIDGRATFVPGALPGEQVRVEVVEEHRRWARARLVEVLSPAPMRVAPPCPIADECGGCDLQHASVEGQRQLKTRVVVEQLERLGGLAHPPVGACRAVGPDVGYRTHAQLHADPAGRLGFHRPHSHEVVVTDRCLVLADDVQRLVTEVGTATGAETVQVRAHARTGSGAVVLHPGAGPLHPPPGDHDVLLAQPDGSTVAIRGDGVLTEEVAGITYRFDASSFFQVNTAGAEAIVAEVRAAIGPARGALVWDLYAGVGLLALALAADGADVVAVEGHRPAADWARTNAADNGLEVEVIAADVREFVGRATDDPPEVVVLDPPRTGAGTEVVSALAALRPATIVYVACDPAALARDARQLATDGYRLVRAIPLDLFPMTHHVEVVAAFVPG